MYDFTAEEPDDLDLTLGQVRWQIVDNPITSPLVACIIVT